MTEPMTQCPSCPVGLVVVAGAVQCKACAAARVPLPAPAVPRPPAAPKPPVLSDVARRLEDVFAVIRRRHPELPHFVVVLATGAEGKKGVTHWGHFASRRWRTKAGEHNEAGETSGESLAEIKISAEGLNRPPVEVLETMLHEAAHALAETRGVKDTSRQGQYHNDKFAGLAREVGLTPPETRHPVHGYAFTTPNADLETRYGSALKVLEAALTLYRAEPGGGGEKAATKPKRVKVACGCDDRAFHIAPGVLAKGGITCDVCGSPFLAEEGPEDDENPEESS